MKRALIILLSSLILILSGVCCMNIYSPFVRIPSDSEKNRIKTNFSQTALDPCSVKLLDWNVYKGNRENWKQDFRRLALDKDLVLIQEAYLGPDMTDALDMKHKGWNFAISFVYKGKNIPTGVLTASAAYPLSWDMLRTKYREPVINTPKVSLITEYEFAGIPDKLLVVNVHAINFVGMEKFRSQMNDLEYVLEQHDGPAIFAGDFNTWSRERAAMLSEMTGRLGLREVSFVSDRRTTVSGHPIDHIFCKGLIVKDSAVAESVKSSDHKPLMAEFALEGR